MDTLIQSFVKMFSLEDLQNVLTPTQYSNIKARLETAEKNKTNTRALRKAKRLLIECDLTKEELKALVDAVVLEQE